MLKSLFSGISGLQSHQIAMDIEANNIANVNTVGFKYSRANFSDLLAQTKSIATAPQGQLGGKNPVQVGLGSTVSSSTRIFSQGSIQNSEKNTDVAIQGDGFFIISPDAGNSFKYTRAGDFKFDAAGNFVDNNGFIAQGWLRDKVTGKVDSTAPITSINIAPGLTTPAQPTTAVLLQANLNSGPLVSSLSPSYEIKSNSPGGNLPALDTNGQPIASGDLGVLFNEVGEAFSLQQDQGVFISFRSSKVTGIDVAAGAVPLNLQFTVDNDTLPVNIVAVGLAGNSAAANANILAGAINGQTAKTGIIATIVGDHIELENQNDSPTGSHNIDVLSADIGTGFTVASDAKTAWKYQYNKTSANTTINADKQFTTIAQLREAMQNQARADGDDGTGLNTNNIEISVNAQGKFEIINNASATSVADGNDNYDMNLKVTAFNDLTNNIVSNTRFTRNLEALNSVLPSGSAGIAFSQSFNAATHSSSVDIFDSLGSKHTLRMEFRKTALDTNTGSTWDITVTVPSPATIDTTSPFNEKKGSVRFNTDGSLATFNPPNVSFSGNNGSAPAQQVNLAFGTANGFDGVTSIDTLSKTSGISQDGFTGGDLVGIKIDQSGTLIGSFSNGRSFGLAQIGMAKFTNNEGLSTEGGNVYIQTANSGDPIIGTAATAGRGFIQAGALEASNVDLSRALTQLIIIQRGFQANGKTITTSDQLLQTLIQLKN